MYLVAKGSKFAPGGEEPTLVKLAKAEVQIRTSQLLRDILPHLDKDPCLDVHGAVQALFHTEADLCIRFSQYAACPFWLWHCCKIYNPVDFVQHIQVFLEMDVRQLDLGYSVGLQKDALGKGHLADQIEYMCSQAIQQEIQGVLESPSHSLAVERKQNLDKHMQGTKGTRIASVAHRSRTSILQAYASKRNGAVSERVGLEAALKKTKTMSVTSIASERCKDQHLHTRKQLWANFCYS